LGLSWWCKVLLTRYPSPGINPTSSCASPAAAAASGRSCWEVCASSGSKGGNQLGTKAPGSWIFGSSRCLHRCCHKGRSSFSSLCCSPSCNFWLAFEIASSKKAEVLIGLGHLGQGSKHLMFNYDCNCFYVTRHTLVAVWIN
jgi:hypothetical protein